MSIQYLNYNRNKGGWKNVKKLSENDCIKLINNKIKTNWNMGGRSTGYIERRKIYEYSKQICRQNGINENRFEEIWNIALKNENLSSVE